MPLTVACSHCDASYRLDASANGQIVRCRSCDKLIRVGGNRTAPPPLPVEEIKTEPAKGPAEKRETFSPPIVVVMTGAGVVPIAFATYFLIGMLRAPTAGIANAPAPRPPDARPPVVAQAPPQLPRPVPPFVAPRPPEAKAPAEPPKKEVVPAEPLPVVKETPKTPPPLELPDPNQIVREPFDLVAFPRTPSRVVALGVNAPFKPATFRSINIDTGVEIAKFELKARDHLALNADGTMLAGFSGLGQRAIEVATDMKMTYEVGPLPTFPGGLFFDFTADGNVFLTYTEGTQKYFVIEPATTKTVAFWQGPQEDVTARAIAPDRKHYASAIGNLVVVRLFDKLQPVKQLAYGPRLSKFRFALRGLAFSPDGDELAVLAEDNGKTRLSCWKWKTGAPVCDLFFDQAIPVPRGFHNSARGLDWLPDGSGWVVQGQSVIDKRTGKQTMMLPEVLGEWGPGLKRFADIDRLILVRQRGEQKSLEFHPLRKDPEILLGK